MATVTKNKKQEIEVFDEQTYETRRLDVDKIGAFLKFVRVDTPSEYWEGTHREGVSMPRWELAEIINKQLGRGEKRITEAVIARIENMKNMNGGYWNRIMQICRGLEVTISFHHRRNRFALRWSGE